MASGRESVFESPDGSNVLLLPAVWSKLPEDLVEAVLKKVPFDMLMRFRTVSTRWNSLITSPKFSRESQKSKSPKPVPILFPMHKWSHHHQMEVFDSKANTWLSRSLPLADPGCPYYLTATSGGLMCFNAWDRKTFVVCNPVTGRLRQVKIPNSPPTGDIRKLFLYDNSLTGLVVDNQAGTFKVIFANGDEEDMRTLVYNSADDSWRSGAPVPPIGLFESRGAVSAKGNIYGVVRTSVENTMRCSVLKYDVGIDIWREVTLKAANSASWKDFTLLEHQSQVVLCARTVAFRWLPFHKYHTELRNAFYRVEEADGGDEMTLVMDRLSFRGFERTSCTVSDMDLVPEHLGGIAGIGDVMYSMNASPEAAMQVVKFNCRTQELSALPLYLKINSNVLELNVFELRLLEPSLTVDL